VAYHRSDLGETAVDEELGTGDEAGVVRGKEQGGLGDLVGLADAAERHQGGERAFAASSAKLSRPGVAIGPGLTTLTRMRRPFSSAVQVRAKERIAALVAP
jgi:hypothetical protein